MTARQEQEAVTTARRLGDRERAILRALYDYELLLTYQLQVLFFTSARRCQDVLRELADLKLIERDIPTQSIGVGRAQPHWTLTESGIHVVAVLKRLPRSKLERMPRETFFAADKQLDHLLGVNRFFVSLVQASKKHPAHGLEKWVPEKYVRTQSSWIRHDGFGRYQHEGGACDFYFEYDRATEWQGQLIKKLKGYVLMAIKWTAEEDPKQFPNLVVLVPTEKREAAFEKAARSTVDEVWGITE
ncbi:MAG: replication-relaxation family protein, partial [Actinobacteria bacterium]|nr:replication-relaxation family protein [Actinomycetota bacterium]